VITGVIGLLLTTFSSSGIGVKLSIGIEEWSGGNLFTALLIIWLVSIVMGMVGVSTIAYFMAAAFGVPVLVDLGVPEKIGHFFVMFPSVYAMLTPPIALAVIVAAKLAGAKYILASIESVKAAFSAFLLPFLIVYAPSIVFYNSVWSPVFWLELAVCLIILMTLQIAFVGYFLTIFRWYERVLSFVASALFMLFLAHRLPALGICALILLVLAFGLHLVRYKKQGHRQNSEALQQLTG
jgi:TRAP-type uncharacterized transport system fused permease subunit